MIQGEVELVDRLGPEGVADLGPVESDAHSALIHRPVIGDVGERMALDLGPPRGIEMLGDHKEECTAESGGWWFVQVGGRRFGAGGKNSDVGLWEPRTTTADLASNLRPQSSNDPSNA